MTRFGVVPCCRALSAHGIAVAPRTYHAWRRRPPSARAQKDAWLSGLLRAVFEPDARGRRRPESLYGAVKIWGWLARQDIVVARCTIERLMRANGWRGRSRGRRKVRTTVPDDAHPRHPDLVSRDFRPPGPGRLLVADFTYVPLVTGGFVYTAFVIDAFAGTIAGWECSASKSVAFVRRAIAQAAAHLRESSAGLAAGRILHHSDAGSQYTSVRCAESLELASMTGSIGSVGDAYDNALAETIIGLYKTECIASDSPFRDGLLASTGGVEKITAAWVHWYNNERLVHRLGLRPPAEVDAAWWDRERKRQTRLTNGLKTLVARGTRPRSAPGPGQRRCARPGSDRGPLAGRRQRPKGRSRRNAPVRRRTGYGAPPPVKPGSWETRTGTPPRRSGAVQYNWR